MVELHRELPLEEGAVALEGQAQIFRRDIRASVPVLFQFFSFGCELGGELADGFGDKLVSLLYGATRLIDESHLQIFPSRPQASTFIAGK